MSRILDLNRSILRLDARDAEQSLRQRAGELAALIQDDPARALSVAFSAETVAELAAKYPDSADVLEQPGNWEGPVQRWTFDYPDRAPRTMIQMMGSRGTLELHFAAGAEPVIDCGSTMKVAGIRMGSLVAVADSSTTSTTQCSTTGAQNTVALLVTFPGVAPPPNVTTQSVHDLLFGAASPSVDSFWRETSHGLTWAAGNVYGWFTLPTTYSCSDTSTLFSDALSAAAGAGVNFQNYTRIFIVVPDFGCGWSGLANIGCSSVNSPSGVITASTSYLNATYLANQPQTSAVQLAAHEGGHNLGLDHAHSLAFPGSPLGPLGTAGTSAEYGDLFSDMSNQLTEHYAAYHKAALLKWMTPGVNYQIVQSSGTWSLQPVEMSPPGLQALKVQRGTGNNAWLWIEYRQPIGAYDSSSPAGSQIFSGALIHYDDGSGSLASNLLDFSSVNTTQLGPALSSGQVWTDPYSNLSIAVQSATPSALTIRVTYGATLCTPANPAVSISPANPNVSAGSTVSYAVSVINQDSAGCSVNTFSLASTQPAGWTGTFSAPSLTLSPAGTGSVTLTQSIPAGTGAGTYPITVTASSGSHSAPASANATVLSTSTLTDTLSLPAASYAARKTVTSTAVILSGGSAAAGAAVSFTMQKPDGTKVNGTATADSNGRASWSYRIAPKDPPGAYSVVSVATYRSQNATSNAVPFTVQ